LRGDCLCGQPERSMGARAFALVWRKPQDSTLTTREHRHAHTLPRKRRQNRLRCHCGRCLDNACDSLRRSRKRWIIAFDLPLEFVARDVGIPLANSPMRSIARAYRGDASRELAGLRLLLKRIQLEKAQRLVFIIQTFTLTANSMAEVARGSRLGEDSVEETNKPVSGIARLARFVPYDSE
jgi:hypothetical protein